MAKVTNLKRITVEEFPQDQQEMVNKLAFSLNPMLEQIVSAFSKNIDFDNLNQEVLSLTITVDATGKPTTKTSLKTSLRTRIKGLMCIRASSYISGVYANATPFISFESQSTDSLINITHVAGLPADKKFDLTLIVIG